MKIVINTCYGGFSVNDEVAEKLNYDSIYNYDRTDSRLIEMIEAGEDVNGEYADLQVVDVPDDATDYYIVNNDGNEDLLYVLDGKIFRAY